ncbi:MAG: methyltransferase domain-containing protein [Candidatus Diapherotrites archaeon]|nr:methyltransferase domain-containing protein [Candidatus Diapherotrites archaeon]
MNEYEITRQEYDKNNEFYAKRLQAFNWQKQIDYFAGLLSGKRVLDAGCGVGRDAGKFLKIGFEVDGIDYSKENLKKAKTLFPKANFFQQNILATNLPSNTYDGIWACASILHLKKKDLPTALSEFNRLLKLHGRLFVSVKQGKGEQMVKNDAGERFFSFFQPDEIKKVIQTAGFKIIFSEIVPHENLTGDASQKPDWICIFSEKIKE